jgi:hypothetical protein
LITFRRSAMEDQPRPSVNEDNFAGEQPSRSPRKPRWPRILLIVLFVGAALWGVDRLMRPAPPPTRGIEITTGIESAPTIKNGITDLFNEPPSDDAHPLDQALEVAQAGLEYYRANVRDYRAVFIKQERVGGRLDNEQRAFIKFRSGRVEGETKIPQAVYMRFLEPPGAAGREVIYIDGQNNGKLVAHEGGLLNLIRAQLAPTSRLAMRGNRHPITEFGIEKLIERMIENGSRDRQLGNCKVEVNRDVRLNDHSGTEIRIIHPEPSDEFDFHIARILIDDELNLPVGYEGYTWPERGSDKPVLIERYFYTELEINVDLSDIDFDPDNPEYEFP